MEFTLQLMGERLGAMGYHVQVVGDSGRRISRVRVFPRGLEATLQAGVLYVCDRACIGDGVANASDCGCECAFALVQRPPKDFPFPFVLVENAPDADSLLNALAEAKDSLEAAISEIGEYAWGDNGLSRIVEALSGLVGNSVYIVDSSFKVMAITNDPDLEEMSVNWMNAARHGYLSYDLVANLVRSNELHDIESTRRATIVESEYFYVPFANYNLRQDGKVQGHLFVVQMYKKISAGDLELVDIVAPFALRALQANPEFQISRGPLYEHFVTDWLNGGLRDPALIRSQLDALSFDVTSFSVIAVIELAIAGDLRRERLARLLEDRQGCRAVSASDKVIALFQLKRRDEKKAVIEKIRGICRHQQCRASVSDVQDAFLDSPRAYRQACEALRIADAMGFDDEVVVYGDVAAYQPYLNFSSVDELEAFCHPAVMSLREHDRAHAVKLLPTLSAFLKNDRDTLVTAAELFIHRNTLSYRMRKINELFPMDLDDFNTRHRVLESILVVENHEGITAHLGGR